LAWFLAVFSPRFIKLWSRISQNQNMALLHFKDLKQWRKLHAEPLIWMHCASLGEFEQGRPLLERLRARYPQKRILLSFFSDSGYSQKQLYKEVDRVILLPLDHPVHALRFVQCLKPELSIFVKYEFWPFYLRALAVSGYKVIAVSAIFRPNHFLFSFWGSFILDEIKKLNHIFTQDVASKVLLEKKALHFVSQAGDTRFDRVVDASKREPRLGHIAAWKSNKKLIVAGSTWPEDETLLFEFFTQQSEYKLILVPHEIHHELLGYYAEKYQGLLYSVSFEQLDAGKDLLIIDSIGLLSQLYAYADLAYIGGAFGKGLHNILEAAVFGIPVFFGKPHFQKFIEAKALLARELAFSVGSSSELQAFISNQKHDAAGFKTASKDFFQTQLGASQKIMDWIEENLD
jgi:3-deoxy-D-manno-octulosonic-acid transferase